MTGLRARRLPHIHAIGQPVFTTWRFHGSLPPNRSYTEATSAGRAFLAIDRLPADADVGPSHLRMPEVASLVVESIRDRMLGTTGHPFLQDESYDRLVRDDREFERIAAYIERNPVDAGFVSKPAQFRWSAAWPIANRPQVSDLPQGVSS